MDQAADRTMRDVPPERSRSGTHGEIKEEGNLLVEAVTLLVQRQRETEAWVAQQIWQAEERAAGTERHYAELEARLKQIEEHVARLVHHLEPDYGDEAADSQLVRLREQIADLKAASNGVPAQAVADVGAASRERISPPGPTSPPAGAATGAEPGARHTTARSVGFWELLGHTHQERAGLIVMGVGGVAVIFAILSQLRF